MGFALAVSKASQLLIVFALTVYWLLLLKLGHQGIQNNVLEILGDVTDGDDGASVNFNITAATINAVPPSSLSQFSSFETNTVDDSSAIIPDTLSTTIPTITTRKNPRIPLFDLVNTDPNPPCIPKKSDKRLVNHTIIESNINHNRNKFRKIPKIVHLTAKSRCMTPAFEKNVDKWRMEGYSVYIHDDAAVSRLMSLDWPEFPHLQLLSQHCLMKGASTADLWRYLVIWEYGGVYADLDSAPGKKLETAILGLDDAFFVVESIGIMSQYFMAGSPHHPYFHLCVMVCLERLMTLVNHVGKQNIPVTTGPGVVKVAMIQFMKNVDSSRSYGRIQQGTYTGVAGRSIRVVGSRGGSGNWVIRESMKKQKQNGYAAMGMKHFSKIRMMGKNASCHETLYNAYVARTTTTMEVFSNATTAEPDTIELSDDDDDESEGGTDENNNEEENNDEELNEGLKEEDLA